MKSTRYMATVLPGLEDIAVDEIQQKFPKDRLLSTSRGKVFFESYLPTDHHFQLKTVDHLYLFIGQFSVGPHKRHLSQIEERVATFDLSFAKTKEGFEEGYFVNASRRGKHTYSRFEAAEAAMRGIASRYPGWTQGTAPHHSLEFRLDLDGDQAVFSLRLTDSSFRYRGRNRLFSPAALRPTVAHALVWCSSPAATDLFVDPCCGSGTILSERLNYPFTEIRGGDLSETAVRTARSNLGEGVYPGVQRWDARQLPLDRGYASKFVSNLPFGRQTGNRSELGELYDQLIRETSRVLKPGGIAIFLTEEGSLLRRAADRNSLDCQEWFEISLKGLRPAIYRLQK